MFKYFLSNFQLCPQISVPPPVPSFLTLLNELQLLHPEESTPILLLLLSLLLHFSSFHHILCPATHSLSCYPFSGRHFFTVSDMHSPMQVTYYSLRCALFTVTMYSKADILTKRAPCFDSKTSQFDNPAPVPW